MMNKKNIPKNQHYVPQFLLANFTNDDTKRIWVFDKALGNFFKTHIKNVASENLFYNLIQGIPESSLEPIFNNIETNAAVIISNIIDHQNIYFLSDNDREVLSHFIAIQYFRTRGFREQLKDMDKKTIDALQRKGIDTTNVENYTPFKNDEEIKQFALSFMVENAKYLVPHVLDKVWVLIKDKKGSRFYISDHPIVLCNSIEYGLRGNLGFAVAGIEIYIPLSSSFVLAFYCPKIIGKFIEGLKKINKNKPFFPAASFITAIENGLPFECFEENITFMNSLQVKYSERQVYCEYDNFTLVQEMIKENGNNKMGMRSVVT